MTRALVPLLGIFFLVAPVAAQPEENTPPDCTAAVASVGTLWPPNHAVVEVAIQGVTDADGDAPDVTITGVTQDEPLVGAGDGDLCPDATGVGVDERVGLRAERSGAGDGRVYHVSFTADDGLGGSCSGAVVVCVPHDQGQGSACADGGALVDATGGEILCDGEACDADECTVVDLPDACAGGPLPRSITRRLDRSALLLERALLADDPEQEVRSRLRAAKLYRKASTAAAKAAGRLAPGCGEALAGQLAAAHTCASCLLPAE